MSLPDGTTTFTIGLPGGYRSSRSRALRSPSKLSVRVPTQRLGFVVINALS